MYWLFDRKYKDRFHLWWFVFYYHYVWSILISHLLVIHLVHMIYYIVCGHWWFLLFLVFDWLLFLRLNCEEHLWETVWWLNQMNLEWIYIFIDFWVGKYNEWLFWWIDGTKDINIEIFTLETFYKSILINWEIVSVCVYVKTSWCWLNNDIIWW